MTLRLYADTNLSGGLDGADALLATTTTTGGGLYSFVGLAPGEYIVAVESTNFNPGGALYDAANPIPQAYTSISGNPDPDNDADNDDNGGTVGGVAGVSIASAAITLNYDDETTADGTGKLDINNTLDLGFQGTPPNAAPVIGNVGGAVGYTEQQTIPATTVQIDGDLTVNDDTPDLIDSATVTISTGFVAGDQLTFTAVAGITGGYNPGTGVLSFTGTASEASYETLLRSVTFSSTSDNPTNFGANPSRTITWTVNDGTQDNAVLATSTVNITPVNDQPALNGVAANAVYLVGSPTATTLDTTLTVADADNQFLTGATVTITDFSSGDELLINGLLNGLSGGVTFSYDGNGLLTLSGSATLAVYEGLLEQVQYRSTDPSPSDGTPTSADHSRTVQWQLNDGSLSNNLSVVQTTTVLVDAAPVLDLDTGDGTPPSGFSTTFEEDAAPRYFSGNPVSIGAFGAIDISDVDDPAADITSATVKLTNAFAGDVLTVLGGTANGSNDFGSGNPISWVINTAVANEITVTLTGPASAGDYASALGAINFDNTSNTPDTTARTVTAFVVGSGGTPSNIATATIQVVAVNDTPVNAVPTGPLAVNEDTDLSITGISISDVDANPATQNVTVTLGVNSGTLTIATGVAGGVTAGQVTNNGTGGVIVTATQNQINTTLAALNGLVYRGNLNFSGPDQLSITTNDNDNGLNGVDPDTLDPVDPDLTSEQDIDTVNITVNAVNDAPVNTVPIAAQAVNEDTNLVFSSGSGNLISVSDADAPSGDVRVTLAVASGTLTLATTAGLSFSTGDGTSDSTMTFDGTLAEVNAALNGLTYRGNLNFFGGDTLSITTNDLGQTGADPGLSGGAANEEDVDQVTINVASVNDAPVNGVPATQSVNEDTDLVFNTANGNLVSIADVDAGGDDIRVTLTVTNGTLTLATTAGLAFSTGDGTTDSTMTFEGTLTEVNAALNGLIYRANLNYFGGDALSITTNDLGNNGADPGGDPTSEQDADSVTINVASINDSPILAGLNNNPSFIENGTAVVLDNDATVSDIELDAAPSYDGAQLTLVRSTGPNPDDVFGGSGSLDLSSGIDVDLGGFVVGTYRAEGDGTFEITFNSSASAADVDLVLQQLTYRNVGDNPPTSLQINYTFSDANGIVGGQSQGGGPTPGIATGSITIGPITQINDNPFLLNVSPTASYTLGSAGVLISPSLVAGDPDAAPPSPNVGLKNAVVEITDYVLGDELFVNLTTTPGGHFRVDDGFGNLVDTTIGVESNALGHLVLSGPGTPTQYQQVLDAVSYRSSAADPRSGGTTPNRTITWQINDGVPASPQFGTQTPYTAGVGPQSIATADLNGDGLLDLVTANNGGTISVLINNPDPGNPNPVLATEPGEFGAPTNFAAGAAPQAVLIADFDHNDTLDVVVANATGISILSGNGSGLFGAPSNFAAGTNPAALAAADFNSDGNLDVAVANFGSGNVSVLLGNGGGGFAAAQNFNTGANSTGVAVGDFNRDGIADLAVSNSGPDNVAILLGTGTGGFGAATTFTAGAGTNPVSIATEDLNGDGRLDLVTANQSTGNVSVMLGNGSGGFGAPSTFAIESTPTNVRIADINADGKYDILATNSLSGSVSVLRGNGNGTFLAALNFATGSGASSVAFGDFNRDNGLDLAVTNSGLGNASVLFNAGSNMSNVGTTLLSFNAAPTIDLDASGGGTGFTTTYTERDAPIPIVDIDITITDPDNAALSTARIVLTNAKAGDVISIAGTLPGGIESFIDTSVPGQITVNLFNSASIADYETALSQIRFRNTSAVPDETDRDITVVVTDGSNAESNVAHATVQVVNLTTGQDDFDASGVSDILWRNTSGTVAEWLMTAGQIASNEGVGTLGSPWSFLDTGDFNADGHSDILWRSSDNTTSPQGGGGGSDSQIVLWTMNGSQIVSNQVVGTVSSSWHELGVGDFNADGRTDVLLRHDNGQVVRWKMDGAQIVSNDAVGSLGNDWHAQGFADFTGDGKSDVLWRHDTGQVVLWTMDDATIANNQSITNLGLDWNIAGTGDFNNDGHADVLLRHDSGQVVLWEMNGAQIVSNTSIATPSNDWKIQKVGDYNGDGSSDVLWRHDNGQVVVWEMNGAQIVSNHTVTYLGGQPAPIGLDWTVQAHHYDLL